MSAIILLTSNDYNNSRHRYDPIRRFRSQLKTHADFFPSKSNYQEGRAMSSREILITLI